MNLSSWTTFHNNAGFVTIRAAATLYIWNKGCILWETMMQLFCSKNLRRTAQITQYSGLQNNTSFGNVSQRFAMCSIFWIHFIYHNLWANPKDSPWMKIPILCIFGWFVYEHLTCYRFYKTHKARRICSMPHFQLCRHSHREPPVSSFSLTIHFLIPFKTNTKVPMKWTPFFDTFYFHLSYFSLVCAFFIVFHSNYCIHI